MVSIAAYYEDKDCRTFSHIIKISYVGSGGLIEVAEENLPTHCFPIGKPLWLHSNNGISVIHGSGLRCVEIQTE